MSVPAKPILIRWTNEHSGEYTKIHGFFVNRNVALAVFDGNLEVHLVQPTDDPNEYELRYASNPMFAVGDHLERIQRDLSELTVIEFAKKYSHRDFILDEKAITDPEFEAVDKKIRSLLAQIESEGLSNELLSAWGKVWDQYSLLCITGMEEQLSKKIKRKKE